LIVSHSDSGKYRPYEYLILISSKLASIIIQFSDFKVYCLK
jgi:hypothetical protein